MFFMNMFFIINYCQSRSNSHVLSSNYEVVTQDDNVKLSQINYRPIPHILKMKRLKCRTLWGSSLFALYKKNEVQVVDSWVFLI